MVKGVQDYMLAAAEQVKNISVEDAKQLASEQGFQFVDVRGKHELAKTGKIAKAISAPRGMLEFLIDSESPYYDKHFSPERKYIVYCAKGGRSSLAAHRMQEMGYQHVRSLAGGFESWQKAGHDIETVE